MSRKSKNKCVSLTKSTTSCLRHKENACRGSTWASSLLRQTSSLLKAQFRNWNILHDSMLRWISTSQAGGERRRLEKSPGFPFHVPSHNFPLRSFPSKLFPSWPMNCSPLIGFTCVLFSYFLLLRLLKMSRYQPFTVEWMKWFYKVKVQSLKPTQLFGKLSRP